MKAGRQIRLFLRLLWYFFTGLILLVGIGTRTVIAQDTTATEKKQRNIQILGAEVLERADVDGEEIWRLHRQVHLRQDSTELWANRATHNVTRQFIIFEGDVLIVDEGDSLRADSVQYNSADKIGHATGNIRLSDGEVEVFAPSGVYYVDEKRAQFEEGVRLVDSTAVLTSRAGSYWTEEKRAEFYEDVSLEEDRSFMQADTVTYFREDEVSLARGNVFIERMGEDESEAEADSLVVTYLFGVEAYHDNRASYSRIIGDPLLVRLERDTASTEIDTLVVRAQTLEAVQQDSLDRLIAVGTVRIWQRSFSATSDSLSYDRVTNNDSTMVENVGLFGKPVAWFQDSQVTGDTLLFKRSEQSVDTVFAHDNAFLAQLDTTVERVHQLKGRTLVGVLIQDTLRTLDVGPNAELVYYRSNENNELDGAVQTKADRVVFHFHEGELARASILGRTEGMLYPVELIPADLELEGYRWIPEQKPTRESLLQDERFLQRFGRIAEKEEPEDSVVADRSP